MTDRHRFDFPPMFTLLYLVDWQEDGRIFPAIHAIYFTEAEALAAKASKGAPDKYWVKKVWRGEFR